MINKSKKPFFKISSSYQSSHIWFQIDHWQAHPYFFLPVYDEAPPILDLCYPSLLSLFYGLTPSLNLSFGFYYVLFSAPVTYVDDPEPDELCIPGRFDARFLKSCFTFTPVFALVSMNYISSDP